MTYEQYEPYIADALEIVSAWPFETEGEFIAAVNDQARLMSGRNLELCPDCPATDTPDSAPA